MDISSDAIDKLIALLPEDLVGNIDNISVDTVLSELGMNSLSYINWTVNIEREFNFEFDVQYLDFSKVSNFKQMTEIILKHIGDLQ